MLDNLSKTAKRKLNKSLKKYLVKQGYKLSTCSTLVDKLQLFHMHNPTLKFDSVRVLHAYLSRTVDSKPKKKKVKKVSEAKAIDKKKLLQIYKDKTDKQFFRSAAWNKLRKLTYKTYRAQCMRCGVKNNLCVAHIHKRFDKPELQLDTDNVQLLCRECVRKPETFGVDYRTSDNLRYDADKVDIKYFR